MVDIYGFPGVELLQEDANEHYQQLLLLLLGRVLPRDVFYGNDTKVIREWLDKNLPLFTHTIVREEEPYQISFVMLSRLRSNAFKFFFEMTSRWIVPGKLLNVFSFFAADFRFPVIGDQVYTSAELVMGMDSFDEFQQVRGQMDVVRNEVCLGLKSSYYARRILEVKGLAADEKAAAIQEHITSLIQRRPRDFGQDVFSEMQHVMVRCPDEFKAMREASHMARIISVMYLFRRELQKRMCRKGSQRHLFLKLVRARLRKGNQTTRVIGLLVGLNFLRRTEVFDQRHLLRAIRGFIPDIEAVEDSFLFINRPSELLGTLYLEVRKKGDAEFSMEEIRRLRSDLPADLKTRIEQLMHPVFMPRNEEEVMRNILSLAGQLKYVRDLPQVMINFEEQTAVTLVFTVVWLRVVKPGTQSLQERFLEGESPLVYRHDRCRSVGFLRRRYIKEATVFRVSLMKEQFLREDHSLDLYRARRFVVDELTRLLGEFRDYNGGMISKQEELLDSVKKRLIVLGYHNDLLLEDFFYSLTPVVMRSVLPIEPLIELFIMVVDVHKNERVFPYKPQITSKWISGCFLVTLLLADNQIKEEVNRVVTALNFGPLELTTATLVVDDLPLLGYILRSDDPAKQTAFEEAMCSATKTSLAFNTNTH